MGLLDFLRGSGASVPSRARQERVLTSSLPVGAAAGSADSFQTGGTWTSFGIGSPSRSGVKVSERTTMALPAVMQALRILTGVFAMVPMHYVRRDGKGIHRLEEDPLYKLMNERPNDVQSQYDFREILLGDILMTGNFYAYVSRDALMRPSVLTRLDPLGVQDLQSFDRQTGQQMFYDATLPDGSSGRFASRDIWHVRGMSRNGLQGLNPISFMKEAFGESIATAAYVQSYWRNNAQPPVILTSDKKIDGDVRQQIKDDWKNRFSGVDNAGEPAVLGNGLKADYMRVSNKDGQLVETRTMQVLDIARAWGVPPHLLFELSKATFGNIEQQSLEFVIYHLGPHFSRVSSKAAHAFAASGCTFIHDPSDLVKGGFLDRAQGIAALRNGGVMSTDEGRAEFNLNPVGGDAGGEIWRPINMGISGQPNPDPATGN
ncbi:phage portal protein [Gluconobacter sp. Gdi]|uniref:phage portal protein n=1 Tax=Gluconobacter sp. Gdi TaxID=2691888 RepID=UPI001753D5E8|nr:phage portal protein [Gluconobacter sp. Gdi]GFE98120.1 portal protein [Gluconobacter sp. Gdi]